MLHGAMLSMLVGAMAFTPVRTQAEEVEDFNTTISEIQKKIDKKNAEINELRKESQNTEEELNVLEEEILLNEELVSEMQGKLEQSQLKLSELLEEIEILEDNIEKRKEQLAEQARAIQVDGNPMNYINFILDASTISETFSRIDTVNKMVEANQSLVEQQEQDKAVVEKHKVETEKVLAEQTEEVNALEEISEQLQAMHYEKEILRNGLAAARSEKESERQRFSNEKNQAEERKVVYEKMLEEKRRAEKAAATRQIAASQNVTMAVPKGGSLGWPASGGHVTSSFGGRTNPITGTSELHAGIDIAGGGSIFAAESGTVTTTSYDAGWGYYVMIDHGGGLGTLYAHLAPGSVVVGSGQSVGRGQHIATMGTTGMSTGVHLHFEVHQNGGQINPAPFLGL